jgi:hypothetical protein
MRRSAVATSLAAICAAVVWLFFDQAKHNPLLAAHAGFLEDPFDAVGSFGIQIAAAAAVIALVWLMVAVRSGRPGWQHRGVLLVAVCSLAVGASDLIGQSINLGLAQAGGWIIVGIGFQLAMGILLSVVTPRTDAGAGSLLERAAAIAPVARRPLIWADRHPWLSGLVVGLLSGAALAGTQMVVEGPPDSAVAAVIVVSILLGAEAIVVTPAWVFLGSWMRLHSLRLRREPQ